MIRLRWALHDFDEGPGLATPIDPRVDHFAHSPHDEAANGGGAQKTRRRGGLLNSRPGNVGGAQSADLGLPDQNNAWQAHALQARSFGW
jgi:hypothetical protein